jgi:HPt (histidine-containing phosphotransfer) domain-containing protein
MNMKRKTSKKGQPPTLSSRHLFVRCHLFENELRQDKKEGGQEEKKEASELLPCATPFELTIAVVLRTSPRYDENIHSHMYSIKKKPNPAQKEMSTLGYRRALGA